MPVLTMRTVEATSPSTPDGRALAAHALASALRKLDEWSKRHVDIQTVSDAAGASAQTAGGGAGAKKE